MDKMSKFELPVIQIAGVQNHEEAKLIADSGANYIGFPLRLEHHPEDISEEYAAEIVKQLPGSIHPVLITYAMQADEIIELAAKTGCGIVQMHGNISIPEIKKLKEKAPELLLIKSIIVGDAETEATIDFAKQFDHFVDAFITDSYDPDTGAKGATGKTHDWNISKGIVNAVEKPAILAGGLDPGNVEDAIRIVRPAGVDVHSGVENVDGYKDRALLEAFVRNAKKGFKKL